MTESKRFIRIFFAAIGLRWGSCFTGQLPGIGTVFILASLPFKRNLKDTWRFRNVSLCSLSFIKAIWLRCCKSTIAFFRRSPIHFLLRNVWLRPDHDTMKLLVADGCWWLLIVDWLLIVVCCLLACLRCCCCCCCSCCRRCWWRQRLGPRVTYKDLSCFVKPATWCDMLFLNLYIFVFFSFFPLLLGPPPSGLQFLFAGHGVQTEQQANSTSTSSFFRSRGSSTCSSSRRRTRRSSSRS